MHINYRKLEDLTILRPEDLEIVEQRAKALDITQCLEYLCLTLTDLSPAEVRYVRLAHQKGVADGIYKAVDKLFLHMNTRNGGASAIEYLRTRSESFQVTATPIGSSGFDFKVIMP